MYGIVVYNAGPMPFRHFSFPVPDSESTPRQRYTLAIVVTVVGFALTLVLNHWTGRQSFQIGVVAVMLSAWFGGFWPGITSAILSAFGTSYLVLEPRWSLAIERWQDGLQILVFLTVAVLMSSLSEARQRAEKALKARTADLEAANKELEAFSYSVSHDLRSPLRAIDGYSKIILDEHRETLPAPVRDHLTFVRRNVQYLDRLATDLLELSRLGRQALHQELVLTDELAREAFEQLKAEWDTRQASGQVSVQIGNLPACRADRTLLRQVFVNLLDNALKFTRRTPQARIEVGFDGTKSHPVYYVRDNGAGFDMAYTDKLFGLFQRLHRNTEYEGTGVGLAIVHRIIARHGGRLWAKAKVGEGATFYFTLHEEREP